MLTASRARTARTTLTLTLTRREWPADPNVHALFFKPSDAYTLQAVYTKLVRLLNLLFSSLSVFCAAEPPPSTCSFFYTVLKARIRNGIRSLSGPLINPFELELEWRVLVLSQFALDLEISAFWALRTFRSLCFDFCKLFFSVRVFWFSWFVS